MRDPVQMRRSVICHYVNLPLSTVAAPAQGLASSNFIRRDLVDTELGVQSRCARFVPQADVGQRYRLLGASEQRRLHIDSDGLGGLLISLPKAMKGIRA
jgi:hypothetical protein